MISERLITQIIRHEGAVRRRGRHIPYKCPAGKLTLGYGRNIEENGISDEEAVLLLKNDLTASERELSLCFLWFEKLNEVRREALINMVFNMGISRLKGFKKMLTFS
ncbi:MAG: hypothetical protein LRY51_09745 [Geovibrio sp.]|nr:hypothetical protein [Geovibrio sp.]